MLKNLQAKSSSKTVQVDNDKSSDDAQAVKSEFLHHISSSLNHSAILESNQKPSSFKSNSIESDNSSGTSSLTNSSNGNTNPNGNVHINQYYFHLGELQQEADQPSQTTRVELPEQLDTSAKDLNRYNYIPHQKTDRVVAVKNNYINGNSKSN